MRAREIKTDDPSFQAQSVFEKISRSFVCLQRIPPKQGKNMFTILGLSVLDGMWPEQNFERNFRYVE